MTHKNQIDPTLLNVKQPLWKKCPECGKYLYYETDGVYSGEFCWNGDYGDVDLVSNVPMNNREVESLLF